MARGKVQREVSGIADFHGDYIIKQVRKRFRVYKDASGYSQTSGQTINIGKVMRDADDKPVSFETVEQAKSWIDKGCVIYPEVTF